VLAFISLVSPRVGNWALAGIAGQAQASASSAADGHRASRRTREKEIRFNRGPMA
jgi:hypothetical protein